MIPVVGVRADGAGRRTRQVWPVARLGLLKSKGTRRTDALEDRLVRGPGLQAITTWEERVIHEFGTEA